MGTSATGVVMLVDVEASWFPSDRADELGDDVVSSGTGLPSPLISASGVVEATFCLVCTVK